MNQFKRLTFSIHNYGQCTMDNVQCTVVKGDERSMTSN